MKMQEIIRARRRALGLTQENVAARLGVTAAAVNKWESGATCPDIALLPPLARLLGTDLNTLLSFQDDLTDGEIADFMRELGERCAQKGFAAGFALAQEKLREFPSCERLLAMTAFQLQSALLFYGADEAERERYRPAVEDMLERAAGNADNGVADLARIALMSRCMERGEFERAEALIDQLADMPPFTKKQYRATVCIGQGQYDEARVLLESSLLAEAGRAHSTLLQLLSLAEKTGDEAAADRCAEMCEQTARLYELGEYAAHTARFQRAMARRDAGAALEQLETMLAALCARYEA